MPAAPVNRMPEMFDDPHVAARGMIRSFPSDDHEVRAVGNAIKVVGEAERTASLHRYSAATPRPCCARYSDMKGRRSRGSGQRACSVRTCRRIRSRRAGSENEEGDGMASIRIARGADAGEKRRIRRRTCSARWSTCEQAAALGARIVCLPETFPGPWTPPMDYDALPELSETARDLDIYLIAGTVEPVPGDRIATSTRWSSSGRVGKRLVATGGRPPRGRGSTRAATFWDFGYTAASELPVFDIGSSVTIGMLVCSEVYVPELSRQLALQGAEIIFMPAGLWKMAQWDTWRVLTRARAIENLAYTATCQNILGHETVERRSGDDLFTGSRARRGFGRRRPRGRLRPRPHPAISGPRRTAAASRRAARRGCCGSGTGLSCTRRPSERSSR